MPSITPDGMSTRGSKSTEDVISNEISDLEPDFPEGGLQAWLAVLGSFLVYFASFGIINSFGAFQVHFILLLIKTYLHFDLSGILPPGISKQLQRYCYRFHWSTADHNVIYRWNLHWTSF